MWAGALNASLCCYSFIWMWEPQCKPKKSDNVNERLAKSGIRWMRWMGGLVRMRNAEWMEVDNSENRLSASLKFHLAFFWVSCLACSWGECVCVRACCVCQVVFLLCSAISEIMHCTHKPYAWHVKCAIDVWAEHTSSFASFGVHTVPLIFTPFDVRQTHTHTFAGTGFWD